MKFTVLTLFPDLLDCFFTHGMMGRALDKGIIAREVIDIRDFSHDRHKTVDDRPYGGGCGMVMKPEPLADAIRSAKKRAPGARVVLTSPQGRPFDQEKALELSSESEGFIFICGRYEGIDERICNGFVDEELSIGDYVMTGGELAAMVVIDSVTRLLPGVLGGKESAQEESFTDERLEYAQYTRPVEFEGMAVPEVLLSGNHGVIREWRQDSSLKRTFLKRADLFAKRRLDPGEKEIMKRWCRELTALVKE